jgi:hypothetical protein
MVAHLHTQVSDVEMRWPWKSHTAPPSPLDEAIMLTDILLTERRRRVLLNKEATTKLRDTVDTVLAQQHSHGDS